MNKAIFIILFLYSAFCYGQICGEIDYTFKTNIDAIYTEYYTMKFNNKESFCLERKIISSKGSFKNIETENGNTTMHFSGRENITKQFFYTNKDETYFKEIYEDIPLLVKENKFNWLWNLKNETKKIGNFICNKATIKFRGRNYTAWYTHEVPLPYGPWKFKGLPGVILEIYDTDKEFHIFSTKITLKKKNCLIKMNKDEFSKAITITNYLIKKDSLLDAFFAKMSSRMPKGRKPLKRDKNCNDCGKGLEIFNEKS